jgi:hypothetical protein
MKKFKLKAEFPEARKVEQDLFVNHDGDRIVVSPEHPNSDDGQQGVRPTIDISVTEDGQIRVALYDRHDDDPIAKFHLVDNSHWRQA